MGGEGHNVLVVQPVPDAGDPYCRLACMFILYHQVLSMQQQHYYTHAIPTGISNAASPLYHVGGVAYVLVLSPLTPLVMSGLRNAFAVIRLYYLLLLYDTITDRTSGPSFWRRRSFCFPFYPYPTASSRPWTL